MHISSQLPDTTDTNMLQQEVRYQENKTPPEPLANLRCWYMNCRMNEMLVKYDNAKLSVIYMHLFQFSLAPRKWFTKEIRDFAWHLHGSHLESSILSSSIGLNFSCIP